MPVSDFGPGLASGKSGSGKIFGWISRIGQISAVHVNFLQLKVMKLVLLCNHLSDLTV